MESVMPSNHLILCRPLLLPPSIFPNIRVFSNESVLHIRWPKDWSFSFSISPQKLSWPQIFCTGDKVISCEGEKWREAFFFFFFLQVGVVLGLHCCTRTFSGCGKQGLLFTAVWGLPTVVSSLVAEHRLLVHRLQQLWHTGSVAPWHVESSWTRDGTHTPHIGRWIPIYWTAKEVPRDGVLVWVSPEANSEKRIWDK